MEMLTIILTAIVSAFFCLGVDILFSEGMLFGWVRNGIESFIDKAENRHQFKLDNLKYSTEPEITKATKQVSIEHKLLIVGLIEYTLKPFVLCVYCFSSVYGFTAYCLMTGDYNLIHWEYAILNSMLCLPLVGFIHAKYIRYVG